MVVANISVLLWQRGKPSCVQHCLEENQAKTNSMVAYGVLIQWVVIMEPVLMLFSRILWLSVHRMQGKLQQRRV